MTDLKNTVDELFAANGLLARELPAYESRPGQRQMAGAVARALMGDNSEKLAVEAETGIGKTMAYLLPAVLSGQRIVVSTNTLNLQDQIINREIPFIRRTMAPDLKAICVKGRRNYLCLHRWQQMAALAQNRLFAEEGGPEKISAWLAETDSGDRAELAWLPDNSPLWREISAEASQCLGSHCPMEKSCFITRLRRRAAGAQLLIVNHHLFFSDLALRRAGFGEVLPRYETVIFDEAHHLENVATQHFGFSFSHYQLLDLAKDVERLAEAELSGKKRDRIVLAARAAIEEADNFTTIFPKEKGRFSLEEFIDRRPDWDLKIQALNDRLNRLALRLQDQSRTNEVWRGLEQRCLELSEKLQAFTAVRPEHEDRTAAHIRWFERREKTVALITSPIDIADLLAETLYSETKCCIFTSATLTAGGNFSYFLNRLGLPEETPTLSLPSPFDYQGRTLLYVPDHSPKSRFPEPGAADYLEKVCPKILEIIKVSRGRTLVLFTSLHAMRQTHRYLLDRLPYPVLLQGEAPRNSLLARFQQQTDSVLLAVASFWEGIDVPGEALSCVIIDKLPFEVPSDPVIMARINKIKERGGNPFFDFQVPRAILALRQGIGRLLRAATDKGLLAVLDIRLFTKGYGRHFRASLPPSPITRDLRDVESFWGNRPAGKVD